MVSPMVAEGNRGTPIYITAAGARTPVGLQAPASAAAVRAGITLALREHPFMVDQVGDPMPAALDALLDPRLMGPSRLLRLMEPALREACGPLESLADRRLKVPVFVGLPELRPGFSARDAEEIRDGILQLEGLPIVCSQASVFTTGHSAGIQALSEALAYLHRGWGEVCLVGGVDSYFHPDTMEWLDGHRQLVGSVSRSGFVPGEAAGVCLLMTERGCDRLGIRPLARVRSVALGLETKRIKTNDMCLGEGLSATIRQAVAGMVLPQERIQNVICDINGERYRSEEWGFVCLRLSHSSEQLCEDPTAFRSPSEFWGDVGAASGPLGMMLACQANVRGYSKGPRTMVWTSSEGGQRGVAVLETPEIETPGIV